MGIMEKIGVLGALALLSSGLALIWIGEEGREIGNEQERKGAGERREDETTTAPLQLPSQVRMEKVRFVEKAGDRTAWELDADSAEIDPTEDVIVLENVQASFYPQRKDQQLKLGVQNGNSSPTKLRAKFGRINRRTKEMEVAGDVEVVLSDGISIFTNTLKWNDAEREIRTSDPVRIRSDGMEIEGTGMVSRVDDSSMKVMGPVSARLYR